MKSFYGNTDYAHVKQFLKHAGAKRFRKVIQSITKIDGTLVTVTRFIYTQGKDKMYGICEPETGLFYTSKKPIGKIS